MISNLIQTSIKCNFNKKSMPTNIYYHLNNNNDNDTSKSREKLNHLLYVDVLKIFGQTKHKINDLVQK